MKWAKSVKVKYDASRSGSAGTGEVPSCLAASSATIRGDADPTWWTCSSAFGSPATKPSMVPDVGVSSVVMRETLVRLDLPGRHHPHRHTEHLVRKVDTLAGDPHVDGVASLPHHDDAVDRA